jgi:hypothetical protein
MQHHKEKSSYLWQIAQDGQGNYMPVGVADVFAKKTSPMNTSFYPPPK